MNGEKRVRAVVFARKKLTQLEFVQLVEKSFVFGCELLFWTGTCGNVVFLHSQILQRSKILYVAFELLKGINQRTQLRNLFHVGLGTLAVRPKIRRSHAPFDSG